MPGGYSPGEYRVTLHFKLHSTIKCDGSACPLSLSLARGGRHLPYLSVTIEARDALRVGAGVDLLYWGARVERAPGGGWVVEAPRLPGRADARLYLLIPASHAGPAAGVGRVDNATAAFLSMAGGAKPRVWLARWLPWALALSPAVPAVIAVAYYALHGREGRPRSPPPVGFPPRTG
ncbi:MAG: hypothetical protein LRS49_01555, partial [Desulfurococcales archaeon]|nr:hypothetical protein [Desulfurococcales archaeon]